MEYVTFIIYYEDGSKETVTTHYREDIESEVDAAWDYIRDLYKGVEYIEKF